MKMRRCYDENYYRLRHPDFLGNEEFFFVSEVSKYYLYIILNCKVQI